MSPENDLLILVNETDEVIGHKSKKECHDGEGMLHRAFSIFVFDSAGRVLIQQRSKNKRLWPLFWSNSCCSHPRRGEEVERAAVRRLQEELGLETTLKLLYKFVYSAKFGEAGSERELCSVLIGKTDAPIKPNPEEIARWCFVEQDELDARIAKDPDTFSPWFKMEWKRLASEYRSEIEAL